ncbi:hypothetical protein F511_40701 [Dorcoceras hygrometricum]|uniref:Uncharacterized protein n=1 Tax=Dorcoceras hygrometricum TaxID=472368 RepID=A0A2Z7BXX0_9LAMI|nr:hypothetical protein F511_40701 [Dorcoceras hygrometricum]
MASSFCSNSQHVDFDSVLAMDDQALRPWRRIAARFQHQRRATIGVPRPAIVVPIAKPLRANDRPACGQRAQHRALSNANGPDAVRDGGAWTRPTSRAGPRPDSTLLRQPALEGLTRSARTDSPRRIGRKQFSGKEEAAAAAA